MNVVRSCPVLIDTSSSRKKQLAGVHTQPVEGVQHVAKHPVHGGQRQLHLDGRDNPQGGLILAAADPGVRAQREVLADEGNTEVAEDAALVLASRQHVRSNLFLPQAEQSFRLDRPLREVRNTFGPILDTRAAVSAIKSGALGHLGMDVYEAEAALFFDDKSDDVIRDDVFERLLTFPNVLVTGHQAFFTEDALTSIAETTIANIDAFAKTGKPLHEVS